MMKKIICLIIFFLTMLKFVKNDFLIYGKKLTKILNELNLANCPDIVLIDAGEKESASNVKN